MLKSANVQSYIKVANQVVSNNLKPLPPPSILRKRPNIITPPQALTSFALSKILSNGKPTVSNSVVGTPQVRCAHTDLQVPDYTNYRRKSVISPTSQNRDSYDDRHAFTYLIAGGAWLATAYSAKSIATKLVMQWNPSKAVLALASVEINLDAIPEGKNVTFKWRGKPLFIKHRTASEIETERKVPLDILRDPETDEKRAVRPEWLIVLGICTHLGCVPIANAGDYAGGYYCPCHGSHYDGSGRIRKGPAPANLEIPEYKFTSDNTVLVG